MFIDTGTFNRHHKPHRPLDFPQHARDILGSSNDVDEDSSLLLCAHSFIVTDVSETLQSRIISVKAVQYGCHTRKDNTIFQLPHPEDGDSTVLRTVAQRTATSS